MALHGDALALNRGWHDRHVSSAAWSCDDSDVALVAACQKEGPLSRPLLKYIYGAVNRQELPFFFLLIFLFILFFFSFIIHIILEIKCYSKKNFVSIVLFLSVSSLFIYLFFFCCCFRYFICWRYYIGVSLLKNKTFDVLWLLCEDFKWKQRKKISFNDKKK